MPSGTTRKTMSSLRCLLLAIPLALPVVCPAQGWVEYINRTEQVMHEWIGVDPADAGEQLIE